MDELVRQPGRRPEDLEPFARRTPAEGVDQRLAALVEDSMPEGTRRAYAAAWRVWSAWCSAERVCVMPAEPLDVARWVADQAAPADGSPASVSSIRKRLAAVRKAHHAAGHLDPTEAPLVRQAVRGAARRLGTAPTRAAEAILPADVRRMLEALDALLSAELGREQDPRRQEGARLRVARDRALLLVGLASGLRRSELEALLVEDLDDRDPRGLRVSVRRGKTDQEGRGRVVAITRGAHPSTCPVAAVSAWIEVADIREGPLWRGVHPLGYLAQRRLSSAAIAEAVARAAELAGLSHRSPHGLRAGHVTARRDAGHELGSIMDTTGHTSEAMVRRYDRGERLWRVDVSRDLGL